MKSRLLSARAATLLDMDVTFFPDIVVEPETGHWQYCEWRKDKHQCRDSNIARAWGQYREPTLRK
jgi:hypothetical protein